MHRLTIISAILLAGCFDVTHPQTYFCSSTYPNCPTGQTCSDGGVCMAGSLDGGKPNPDKGKADGKVAVKDGPVKDKPVVVKETGPVKDMPVTTNDSGPITLATDRVSYWKFDEGSGLEAKNQVSTGKSASLTLPDLWGGGVTGTSLDFQGTASTASILDPGSLLDKHKKMSISFWFAPSRDLTPVSPKMILLQKGNAYHCGVNISASIGGAAKLTCAIYQASIIPPVLVETTFQPRAHEWRLITLTVDGAAGAHTLYINGTKAALQKNFTGTVAHSSSALVLGTGVGSGTKPLAASGRLDELMVWKRALGAAEVVSLFTAHKLTKCNPPVPSEDCTTGGYCTIPAGCFHMGASRSEPCRQPTGAMKESLHQVTLTRTFQISSEEVTDGLYKAYMGGSSPSQYAGACSATCPVETVTWHQAASYCNALSLSQGHQPCYSCSSRGGIDCIPAIKFATGIQKCPGYRLPTEAEWEYAYRGAKATSTHAGDVVNCKTADNNADKVAYYVADKGTKPAKVRGQQKNGWGLYDMAGNVAEWTHDSYTSNFGFTSAIDPVFYSAAVKPVVRGGSYLSTAERIRAAHRVNFFRGQGTAQIGFRCVRTLPERVQAAPATGLMIIAGVVADKQDNLFIGGRYTGNLTLGGKTYTNPATGTFDAFVARISAGGSVQWVKTFGTSASEKVTALTLDPAGNLLVAGSFEKTVTVPTTPQTLLKGHGSNGGFFVLRFTPAGVATVAVEDAGDGDNDVINGLTSVKIGGTEFIYLVGEFAGDTYAGKLKKLSSSGNQDILVARVNGSTKLFTHALKFGASEIDEGHAVVADAKGNAYITGRFKKTVNFGGKSLTAAGTANYSDMFLVGLTDKFAVDWAIRGGGLEGDSGEALAFDSGGQLLVGGYYFGNNAKFGNTTLTGQSGEDAFIANYSAAGTFMSWVTPIATKGTDRILDLAVDSRGNIYFTGNISGSYSYSGRTIKSAGATDVLVGLLNNGGLPAWFGVAGGTQKDEGRGIALDGAGQAHVVGLFKQTAGFGHRKLTSKGSDSDGFIWSWTAPYRP